MFRNTIEQHGQVCYCLPLNLSASANLVEEGKKILCGEAGISLFFTVALMWTYDEHLGESCKA